MKITYDDIITVALGLISATFLGLTYIIIFPLYILGMSLYTISKTIAQGERPCPLLYFGVAWSGAVNCFATLPILWFLAKKYLLPSIPLDEIFFALGWY